MPTDTENVCFLGLSGNDLNGRFWWRLVESRCGAVARLSLSRFDQNLVVGSQDGHSRFIDEVLHVLIWLAEQIAFADDRTGMGGLRTAFPDIDAADGLLAGVGWSLRAGPTVEPVSRFHLDAEQKGLLADIQPRVRIGLDSKAADGAGIVDEQRKNRRVARHDRALRAGDGVIAEFDRVKSRGISGTVAPTQPGRPRFPRIVGAGEGDIARVRQVRHRPPQPYVAQVVAARVLGLGWRGHRRRDQQRQNENRRRDQSLRSMYHCAFPAPAAEFAVGSACAL